MNILTQLVKEKYIAKQILQMKEEMEIFDAKIFIENELNKTNIISIFNKYTMENETMMYLDQIQNEDYENVRQLVKIANLCGYNIYLDENQLANDDFYGFEMEIDIQNMVREDYEFELEEFIISKNNFIKVTENLNKDIKLHYPEEDECNYMVSLIFEHNNIYFKYSYIHDKLEYMHHIK
jgi:hypothetical protein